MKLKENGFWGYLRLKLLKTYFEVNKFKAFYTKSLLNWCGVVATPPTPSPPFLSSDGWTIAKAGNLLKHIGEKNLQKWILAYSNLALVNDNLRGRELFKGSSHALQSYQENMRRYDGAIVTGTAVYLQRNQEALDTLPTEVRVPMKITTSPPRSYQRKEPRP